jgi:organic radical activating enzyme
MDTFCVLPWVGREINWDGKETHCCLLPRSYDINSIRTNMLAGKKPLECQQCWNLEEYGLKSDRQVKNSALDFYWDRDIQSIYEDVKNGLDTILILKLLTSYTCNATCISCNSNSSSMWGELDQRITPNTPRQLYKFVDIEYVKQTVDFKNLKMLSLLGGEPLYEKKNFDLLEYILTLGNDQVFLSLVTNGSVKLSSRQKQILSKFKNVNFSLSIDGVGPVFEYLRFPLKWKDLTRNLEFFKEITNNISANYTLSNLNILYHTQTVDWFNQNNMVYSVSPIYSPSWLQPKALPQKVKQILKQTLTSVDYNTFIGPIHTEQDEQNVKLMFDQIKIQDTAKKIQMKDYLPELHNMLA